MKTNLKTHSMFVSILRSLSKIAYRAIALFLFFCLPFSGKAQTHVGGGIFNNTVWLKVNSPYIVDSTINVYAGVTLTIEPGVVVQFDTLTGINLNQATLIATGTSTDSIIFTCNKPNPAIVNMGGFYSTEWESITATNSQLADIAYCRFDWASKGLSRMGGISPLRISHSTFRNNESGFYGPNSNITFDTCSFFDNVSAIAQTNFFANQCLFFNNGYALDYCQGSQLNNSILKHNGYNGLLFFESDQCRIFNCVIDSNSTGVYGASLIENSIVNYNGYSGVKDCDSVVNCTITNNGSGVIYCNTILGSNIIQNDTGIFECQRAHCNAICNNGINVVANLGGTYLDYQNNYWCTTDSALIAGTIIDGYDNSSFNVVWFIPVDSPACTLFNGIPEWTKSEPAVILFPNPAQKDLTVSTPGNRIKQIQILNYLGQSLRMHSFTDSKISLDIETFPEGMYWLEITTEHALVRKPFYKIE